jgi:Tfp pilus assembly protein PilO
MQVKYKIVLCVAPYLVAVGTWFGLTNQSITDWQDKGKELDEKTQEQADLKSKLTQLNSVEKEKNSLDGEIQQLRASVPKNPDVDVLIIDMEKMALESDVDIVSIGKPTDSSMKAMSEAESKDMADSKARSKNLANVIHGGGAADEKKPEEKKPEMKKPEGDANDTGLSKEVLHVGVTGSYQGLIELMRKLSQYQRIIGVNQIEVSLPQASAKMTADPAKRLNIDFILTAYYLP